jgi:hypothetical protein
MSQLPQPEPCAKIVGATPPHPERRREPRVSIARPLYVKPADSSRESFEEVLTMRNFSRYGVYMMTERSSYIPGMRLYVIPAFGGLNLEYLAEVTRVEALPLGEYGVAIRLARLWNLVPRARTAILSAF